jgi:hypothetical protein
MEPQKPAEQDPKDLAFYAASVEAWYSTGFERDKSLLTLAGGGIGLLITLLSTVGTHSNDHWGVWGRGTEQTVPLRYQGETPKQHHPLLSTQAARADQRRSMNPKRMV